MISKELLSEVLGKRIHSRGVRYSDDGYVHFTTVFGKNEDSAMDTCNSSWNIYELAHKCKEWAFNKDCFVESAYCVKGNFSSSYAIVKSWNRFEVLHKQHSDTEPEAIFKACQWVLDNKDKQ